jgi:hypothetical protein
VKGEWREREEGERDRERERVYYERSAIPYKDTRGARWTCQARLGEGAGHEVVAWWSGRPRPGEYARTEF